MGGGDSRGDAERREPLTLKDFPAYTRNNQAFPSPAIDGDRRRRDAAFER